MDRIGSLPQVVGITIVLCCLIIGAADGMHLSNQYFHEMVAMARMKRAGPAAGGGPRKLLVAPAPEEGQKSTGYSFGETFVVDPKGEHLATVVWLHGITEDGYRASLELQTLPLNNIKFICPTAPKRPVTAFGGSQTTAWFDVQMVSPDACPTDTNDLDAAAALVAKLLADEPPNVKIGVGGFSLGAATSLYTATCSVIQEYGNGDRYPVDLRVGVALSGWLPCSRKLMEKVKASNQVAKRAATAPYLICHGKMDNIVMYRFGEETSQIMTEAGFKDLTFKGYEGLGHAFNSEETNDIVTWLNTKLNLTPTSR